MFSIAICWTWEGESAREAMIAFVRRWVDEPIAEDDDVFWHCLEDTIVFLGIKEL